MLKPLEYNSGLNLNEARERYEEVCKEFQRVKLRYSRVLRRFTKSLREEDKEALKECIGVLLPLSLEESVQREVAGIYNLNTEIPLVLHYRIAKLQADIFTYLARFRNSGVKLLESDKGLAELI